MNTPSRQAHLQSAFLAFLLLQERTDEEGLLSVPSTKQRLHKACVFAGVCEDKPVCKGLLGRGEYMVRIAVSKEGFRSCLSAREVFLCICERLKRRQTDTV